MAGRPDHVSGLGPGLARATVYHFLVILGQERGC